jgi:putative membrane protein insertion efficiency factor
MRAVVRIFIRSYQIVISPALSFLGGPHSGCRFSPTCSDYFLQAVETHGVLRGVFLGVKRLLRCQPWGGSGFDPVPVAAPVAHGCVCE